MKICKGYIDKLETEIVGYDLITTLYVITEKGHTFKKTYNDEDIMRLVDKLGCVDMLGLFDAEVCVVYEDDWHPLYLCKDLFNESFGKEADFIDFKGDVEYDYGD